VWSVDRRPHSIRRNVPRLCVSTPVDQSKLCSRLRLRYRRAVPACRKDRRGQRTTTRLVQSGDATFARAVLLTSQYRGVRRERFHRVVDHGSQAIRRVFLLRVRDSWKLQVMQMVTAMQLVSRLLSQELLLLARQVELVRLRFRRAVVLPSFSTSAIQTP